MTSKTDHQPITYMAILRADGVLRPFTASLVARLSYAMFPLVMLIGIERATGSFAAAGAALSAYSVATLTVPLRSRWTDRLGQRRVLIPLAAGSAVVLGLLAAAMAAGFSNPIGYVALAGLAGLMGPPIGGPMRAIWAVLTPQPAARQRAYSLDTVVEEVLWGVGPVLSGAAVALVGVPFATVLSALLLLVGTVAMATSPASFRTHVTVRDDEAPASAGLFRLPGFVALILIAAGIGFGFGSVDLIATARGAAEDSPVAAGLLVAAFAAGGGVGGLLWGRLELHSRPTRQLAVLLVIAAAVTACSGLTSNLLLFGAMLVLMGATSIPLIIVAYIAMDGIADDARRTEASTWINTAQNLGLAASAAAAGVLVERASPGVALIAGAAVLLLLAVAVLAAGRPIDGNPSLVVTPHPKETTP